MKKSEHARDKKWKTRIQHQEIAIKNSTPRRRNKKNYETEVSQKRAEQRETRVTHKVQTKGSNYPESVFQHDWGRITRKER